MGRDLDTGQYLLYMVGGVAAIALIAWALHAWWRWRRPHDPGGAAAYLTKIFDGYELTPTSGGRGASTRYRTSSPRWRCALSDDTDGVRTLLDAPVAPLDQWVLETAARRIVLADGQAVILSLALRAGGRDVRRARKILAARHVDDPRVEVAQATLRAGELSLVLGQHRVELNEAGVEFAAALVSASRVALGDAAAHLGVTHVPGADWMPGDEFDARGGVLRDY